MPSAQRSASRPLKGRPLHISGVKKAGVPVRQQERVPCVVQAYVHGAHAQMALASSLLPCAKKHIPLHHM